MLANAGHDIVPIDPQTSAKRLVGARILVLSAHAKQVDRRILAQMSSLARAGAKVRFLSIPADIDHTLLHPTVEVVFTNSQSPARQKAPRWVVRAAPAWAHRLRRNIKYLRKPDPDPWYDRVFASLAGDTQYDAVHAHDLITLPAAVHIAERINARVIYDSHELYPDSGFDPVFQRYWSAIEHRYIHHADAVVTVNQSIAEVMQSRYEIPRPSVLHNAIDPALINATVTRQDFLRQFKLPNNFNTSTIIFQGSLTKHRGLELLTQATHHLESTTLLIQGEGQLLSHMQRHAAPAHTRFGSWLSQSELLAHTRHATAGIIPYQGERSLNHQLCTPNKLYEFAAVGLPVLARDLPELTRLVTEHQLGRVDPMSSPKALAKAIDTLTADIQAGTIDHGQPLADRTANTTIGWAAHERDLLDLYSELIIDKTPRSAQPA